MSDFRERGSIFKQMAEMKKKIQLVRLLGVMKTSVKMDVDSRQRPIFLLLTKSIF